MPIVPERLSGAIQVSEYCQRNCVPIQTGQCYYISIRHFMNLDIAARTEVSRQKVIAYFMGW